MQNKENIYVELKRKKRIFVLLMILLVIYILYLLLSASILLTWVLDSNKTQDITEEIEDSVVIEEIADSKTTELVNPPVAEESDYWYYIKQNLLEVNFTDLIQKNSDTVGWVQLPGTNINYPVVQTTDNSFYLSHSYNKESNNAGWVFMDYRNHKTEFDNNTIIYAHSRNDTTMFGSLKNVLTNVWLENRENHIVYFSTPYENTMWQVFSVYTIPSESYYITPRFETEEEYTTFLITLKNRSIYDFNTELNINDKVLTLSTCQDNYGNRVVLHARLIKRETRVLKRGE